jgi:hypothetical protein
MTSTQRANLMRNIEFHLNVLLAEAERLYGPRDATYRFAGVRLDPKGPRLWFSSPTSDEIWIELSPSTMSYPDQALHQLAHEVIHLVAPDRSPPAVMLEEGLAVHFSVYAPTFISPTYRRDALKYLITTPSARNYLDALCVYNELVAIEPNAIVVLRQKEPKFHAMDPSFIMSMIPQVREELAERLCERRQMRMDAFTSAASTDCRIPPKVMRLGWL